LLQNQVRHHLTFPIPLQASPNTTQPQQGLFQPNIFTQGLQNLATAQNFLGSPVSKGSVPSPSAPSPTLTGIKRSESPKSPTTTTPVSAGNHHMPGHLLSQSVPISTPSSLLQTLTSQTYSNATPQLSLFENSLPSPSRAESCNVMPQRVSPSSHLHHHKSSNGHGQVEKAGAEQSSKFLMTIDASGLTVNRTPTSSPASTQLPKAVATANLQSATRPSDLNPDEMTDLEELEQFAKTFKQRRIKLGKCALSHLVPSCPVE